MVLVNGTEGIGTGFSTNIPCFSPLQIIHYIKDKLLDKDPRIEFLPFYKGFQGKIEKTDEDFKFKISGVYKVEKKKVVITELPVGTWTVKKKIDDFTYENTDTTVRFDVFFKEIPPNVEEILNLSKTIKLTNMHLFTPEYPGYKNPIIKRFNSVPEIIDLFMEARYVGYEKRKQHQLQKLEEERIKLTSKARFIELFVNDQIIIHKKSYDEIIRQIENHLFPKIN